MIIGGFRSVGSFIPGKDNFWRQRRTFQRWHNSSEDRRRSLHKEGIMWRHSRTKIWEKLHLEAPEVSFSVVTFAPIFSRFIASLYRDWPDGKFYIFSREHRIINLHSTIVFIMLWRIKLMKMSWRSFYKMKWIFLLEFNQF